MDALVLINPEFHLVSPCDYIGEIGIDSNVITQNYFCKSRFPIQWPSLACCHSSASCDSDVIVIGGGLASIMAFAHIKKVYPNLRVLIISESQYLAQSFLTRTLKLNQRILRSPYSHQLAPDGDLKLVDFAKINAGLLSSAELRQVDFASRGLRSVVPLDLFIGHLQYLIEKYEMPLSTLSATVLRINKGSRGYIVACNDGRNYKSNYVVVASGVMPRNNDHDEFEIDRIQAVSGSGMSACAILVWKIMKDQHVNWFCPKYLPVNCSDVPLRFFRSSELSGYRNMPREDRINQINAYRKSSIIPEYADIIAKAIKKGIVSCYEIPASLPRDKTLYKSTGYTLCEPPPSSCYDVHKGYVDNIRTNSIFAVGAPGSLQHGPGSWNIDGMRIGIENLILGLARAEVPASLKTFSGTAPIV